MTWQTDVMVQLLGCKGGLFRLVMCMYVCMYVRETGPLEIEGPPTSLRNLLPSSVLACLPGCLPNVYGEIPPVH